MLDDSSKLWPSKWQEALEEKDKRQAPSTICLCCNPRITRWCYTPTLQQQDDCAEQILCISKDAILIALQVHTWKVHGLRTGCHHTGLALGNSRQCVVQGAGSCKGQASLKAAGGH